MFSSLTIGHQSCCVNCMDERWRTEWILRGLSLPLFHFFSLRPVVVKLRTRSPLPGPPSGIDVEMGVQHWKPHGKASTPWCQGWACPPMADQGRHLPPQKGKLLPDVRDTDVEMADISTGPQLPDHSKQAWAWQALLWLVLDSCTMWLFAGVQLLRALRMSHCLTSFTSPLALAVPLFCLCVVFWLCLFLVFVSCVLQVLETSFWYLIENARWPTMLHRSIGYAQKKKSWHSNCFTRMMLSYLSQVLFYFHSTFPFSPLRPSRACHLVTSIHSMTPRPCRLYFRLVLLRYRCIPNNTSAVSVAYVLPIHLNLWEPLSHCISLHPIIWNLVYLICLLSCLIRSFDNLLDNLHPNCTRSCPLTSLTEGRSARDFTQLQAKKKAWARGKVP